MRMWAGERHRSASARQTALSILAPCGVPASCWSSWMTVARLRFDNLRAPGDGLKLAGGGRGTAGFVLRPLGRAL